MRKPDRSLEGVPKELSDQENSEPTAGGIVGALAGKAKQAAGSLVGNKDVAREGRLQQAQVDAEAVLSENCVWGFGRPTA